MSVGVLMEEVELSVHMVRSRLAVMWSWCEGAVRVVFIL